jgi:hypothetical protein
MSIWERIQDNRWDRVERRMMSTTIDLYSHVMPSMQKDAVKKFETALETFK